MPKMPNRTLRSMSQPPSPRTSTSAMTSSPTPASATLLPRLLAWARRCARPDDVLRLALPDARAPLRFCDARLLPPDEREADARLAVFPVPCLDFAIC